MPRPWTSGPNKLSTIIDTFNVDEGLLVSRRDFMRKDPLNKDTYYASVVAPAHSGVRSPLNNYYNSAHGGIGGVLVCTAPGLSERTEYLGKERAELKHGARNTCIHKYAQHAYVFGMVDARSNGPCCILRTAGLLLRR